MPPIQGGVQTSGPGVATLVRDPATTAADAEAADAALAASGDGRAFERLYRVHVARIHSLVRRMLDGARQVFLLHDVAGYRHEEIAELLGVAPGTSKSQLHHARMALRRHLQ